MKRKAQHSQLHDHSNGRYILHQRYCIDLHELTAGHNRRGMHVYLAAIAKHTCFLPRPRSAPGSRADANDTAMAPIGCAGALPSFDTMDTTHSPVWTLQECTDKLPSLDAAAKTNPRSCGAQDTLFIEPAQMRSLAGNSDPQERQARKCGWK